MKNILTAALAAAGALAIAFTLVVSSPATEAKAASERPENACMEAVLDRAMCLRIEVRNEWKDGADIDMGAAMKAIAEFQKCGLESCRGIAILCTLQGLVDAGVPLEVIKLCTVKP
jgi:hypothetical protein